MDRREFLQGTLAAAASAAIRGTEHRGSRRPNLVYVFADQLRYSSCGYAGDEYARTPNMDALKAQGCDVRQAISSTPVCAPYRASLMTGKYQSSTGMVINELRLSPEHECLGKSLTQAGYQTAYIGKWHLWANEYGHHDFVRNGFVPPGPYRLGFDGLWEAYNFNHNYYQAPYFLNDAEPHIRKGYEPDGQTDEAINYVKKAKASDAPFALFLSWGPPHYPWGLDNVSPEYAEKFQGVEIPLSPNYSEQSDPYADDWQKLPAGYDTKVHDWLRTYYAQVANLDANLGRLLKAIDESGLRDDTIFIFTSDHGEMFGSHGRQAKLIFYEEAARVPFLIRWPGRIATNSISEVLLGTPDIMPTLLSFLGIPIPPSVEGTDLSASILQKSDKGPSEAYLQGMGNTAIWKDGTEWRAVRDHEFTYAIYRKDGRELLFHNRTDPYQLTDLATEGGKSATLTHYRDLCKKWRKEHNDTFEACSWYEAHWTTNRNITMTATGVSQDLNALGELREKWFQGGALTAQVHRS